MFYSPLHSAFNQFLSIPQRCHLEPAWPSEADIAGVVQDLTDGIRDAREQSNPDVERVALLALSAVIGSALARGGPGSVPSSLTETSSFVSLASVRVISSVIMSASWVRDCSNVRHDEHRMDRTRPADTRR